MVNDSFFEIPKKKDKFEPLPLYIEVPMPLMPEDLIQRDEEEHEERGIIIIELFL
jgi:hypothetical protein